MANEAGEVERSRLPDDAALAFGRILGRCMVLGRELGGPHFESSVQDDLLVIIAAVRADERERRDRHWLAAASSMTDQQGVDELLIPMGYTHRDLPPQIKIEEVSDASP